MNSETVTSADLHAAYRKINRLGLEQKNVLANLEEIDQGIRAVCAEILSLEQERDLALRNGSTEGLRLAEAALSEARGRAGELKGRWGVIVRLRDSMHDELRSAKAAGFHALAERTTAAKKSLADAIRADAKIQQLLANLFLSEASAMDADVHPNGMSGAVRWEALIVEMFPLPADSLIEASAPAFRKLHGIPLLADVGAQDA